MSRHTLRGLFLALAGTVLLLAPPARAQITADQRLRVQSAIDITDQRIATAQDLLTGCNSPDAQREFTMAVDLQTRAKSRLSTATMAFELDVALRLTLEAREHAIHAIALARCCVEGGRIENQLDRTDEMLQRARDRVEDCRVDRARALLRTAVELQTRARNLFREGRCLVALQLSMQARERALDALRLCGFEDRAEDRVQQFLEQTDVILERAKEVVEEQGGERAHAALQNAADLQSRAQVRFQAGDFEASLRLSRAARGAAERAVRLAKEGR